MPKKFKVDAICISYQIFQVVITIIMCNMSISIISHKNLEQDCILWLAAYQPNMLANELNLNLLLFYKFTLAKYTINKFTVEKWALWN